MFGMNLDEIRLSRKLLEELIFESMPSILGQRFDVDGVEDFAKGADLLPLVDLEGRLKTEPSSIKGTLLKHGFVDLHFGLTRSPGDIAKAGARVLSTLLDEGGIDRKTEHPNDRRVRTDHLQMLCEDVDCGELELAVFAQGTQTALPIEARFRQTQGFTKTPKGFFPQEFEVTDAYITNAAGIGLLRHFYM